MGDTCLQQLLCNTVAFELRVMYGGRIRRHFTWYPSIFRSSALFSHMACNECHKFDPTHIWKIWCFAGCAEWTWHPLQWIKALVGEWSRYHLRQIMYDTSWCQALVFLLETVLARHPADPPTSLCSCMPDTFVKNIEPVHAFCILMWRSQRTLRATVCQHYCLTCESIAFTTVWKRCLCQHIWRNSGWKGHAYHRILPAHFSIALAALAAAVTLMSARLAGRSANQRAAQAPMASALGNVTFVNGFPVPVFATNKCLIGFRTMAHYHACLTLGICLSADFLVSVFASQYLKKLSLSAHFAYQCLEMGVFCKVFVRSNVFVTAFRILVGNPCP